MKIEVKDISKTFKNRTILENVNMELESGNIYGFIGHNGSGKTVLMKIICGIMKPTTGQISVDQKILHKDIRIIPNVGVIFEKPEFFNDLSAHENLSLLANINKKITDKDIDEVIALVGLNPTNHSKLKTYSLGMVQRLGIAQAIMEDQKVLILDEPTNALDEDGIELIHTLLKRERDKGKLIIVSSHHAYDIDNLCDKVYRMVEGKVKEYEK